MRLYLVRHGIAINRDDPACPPEPDRHLTLNGVAKTEAALRGARVLGIQPGLILTSPYLRAVQTAEIACSVFGYPAKKLRRTDALLPEGKPEELIEQLAAIKADEVMAVGHAPNLDLVIAAAVGNHNVFTALKKVGVACLEMESVSPLKAVLLWLYTPKALRKLGEC